MPKKTYLGGIDIGTTKIVAVIGELMNDSTIEIVGFGKQPSVGVKMGELINLEDTAELVRKAIEEAERSSNISMQQACISISGNHIKSENFKERVSIFRGREIKDGDIDKLLDIIKNKTSHDLKRYLLHTLPYQYILDGQEGIKNPRGMVGHLLEVEANVVTADASKIENLMRCIQRTGVHISEFVVASLAAAESVLTDDEKELGVILVDMGGGTWDVGIFGESTLRYAGVINLGSEYITRDLSLALNIPLAEAEELKKKYGSCLPEEVDDEPIEVTLLGRMQKRTFSRQRICEIIEARIEEIFNLLREMISSSGYEGATPGGVILTGGGSLLRGIEKFAERILKIRARIGFPTRVSGLTNLINEPAYATSLGTLIHSWKHKKEFLNTHQGGIMNLIKRFKRYF
jgi:cell division protein FtsA